MEHYTSLNKRFINGIWKNGSGQANIANLNPFTDKAIHHLKSAGRNDVDSAFSAAEQALTAWGNSNRFTKEIFF